MANMATDTRTVAQRRFTVAEYHLMAETGILSPVERVELVRGAVLKVSPRNRRHVIATRRVFNFFLERLEGRASVYKEDPLVLKELDSEPEPDVLVCSNPDFEAYGTEATKPLLVVEVAESSLRDDLGDKAALYAEAGIPEYWVVNLVDRVLVVFREPGDVRYQTRSTLEPGARVAPGSWPDLELDIASLFPDDA